jgi:hypothetical protein
MDGIDRTYSTSSTAVDKIDFAKVNYEAVLSEIRSQLS